MAIEFCTRCGARIDTSLSYCADCGAERRLLAPPPAEAPPSPPDAPPPEPPLRVEGGLSLRKPKGEAASAAPISAAGYFGIFLLMALPGVNVLLLLLWAAGGCTKKAKRSLARGMLCALLCVAAAAALAVWLFGNPLGAMFGLL